MCTYLTRHQMAGVKVCGSPLGFPGVSKRCPGSPQELHENLGSLCFPKQAFA